MTETFPKTCHSCSDLGQGIKMNTYGATGAVLDGGLGLAQGHPSGLHVDLREPFGSFPAPVNS